MSGGRVEERGDARRVLRNPQAEYTRGSSRRRHIALRGSRRGDAAPRDPDAATAPEATPDPIAAAGDGSAASAAPEPMLVVTELSKTYHHADGRR